MSAPPDANWARRRLLSAQFKTRSQAPERDGDTCAGVAAPEIYGRDFEVGLFKDRPFAGFDLGQITSVFAVSSIFTTVSRIGIV